MFSKKGKDFFLGINYWDSVHATEMWKEFDETVIEQDFRSLRSAGIQVLRVFPRWSDFQPLTALYTPNGIYEIQMDGKPLPDTEAGKAGVSEEACRRFERFCELAEQYEMKLIVGVITGQMSFALFEPDALKGRDPLTDPYSIRWQIRFTRYFVRRMKKQKSIVAWDLGNEPSCLGGGNSDEFYSWMNNIGCTIRSEDPGRLLISGMGTVNTISTGRACYKDVGEICDWNTTHPYAIFETPSEPLVSPIPILNPAFYSRLSEDVSGTPTFPQEFGAIGYLTCGEEEEAQFYRAAMLLSIAHCCHGGMYWCAFDQGHLEFAPYNWNTIGSQYGFFRQDNSPKPIVEANLELQSLLDVLPEDFSAPVTEAAVLIQREDTEGIDSDLRATFALAKRAGFDVSFHSALDPIPDSDVYLFPSVRSNKAIPKTRLNQLLEKVRQGATLYLSLDTALFREIPEITGVRSHARYIRTVSDQMNLDGEILPLSSAASYRLEPITAEVLARDSAGNPVFFKNRYGEGTVYFTSFPVEHALFQRPGVFYEENVPAYERIYQKVMEKAPRRRIAATDHPFVFLTEHIVDADMRYLFAVNASGETQKATIRLSVPCELSVVWGSELSGNELVLKAGSGILLKATARNE